jgi:hypothetical protein
MVILIPRFPRLLRPALIVGTPIVAEGTAVSGSAVVAATGTVKVALPALLGRVILTANLASILATLLLRGG